LSEYVLEIVEGPEAGRQIPLGERSVEIGREEGVGILLANDSLVSRRHARLTPSDRGVLLEDLESSNGTFVDGQEIHSAIVLSPGSELTIGVTVLEFRTAAQAAAATSVRPVPAGLTFVRPAAVPSDPSLREAKPTGLAAQERRPDYVPSALAGPAARDTPLGGLLDIHTKRRAKTAPLAIFVLVAFVVIVGLALR
jgi:pSer/pThr/pTyr-binding forkhead associated (FHA) protein